MAQDQGLNQIRQELQNVNFPATKDEVMNKLGTRQIKAGDRTMNMRDVLGKVNRDRFESQDDLIRDIQSNVPELRS